MLNKRDLKIEKLGAKLGVWLNLRPSGGMSGVEGGATGGWLIRPQPPPAERIFGGLPTTGDTSQQLAGPSNGYIQPSLANWTVLHCLFIAEFFLLEGHDSELLRNHSLVSAGWQLITRAVFI